jgi:hypothetical protein
VGAEGKYINTLVKVYLTNGYGTAISADVYYQQLINDLTPKQAIFSVVQIFEEGVSSKLQIPRCEEKFYNLIALVEKKISTHAAMQLISEIKSRKYPLSSIRAETKLKKLADTAITEIK